MHRVDCRLRTAASHRSTTWKQGLHVRVGSFLHVIFFCGLSWQMRDQVNSVDGHLSVWPYAGTGQWSVCTKHWKHRNFVKLPVLLKYDKWVTHYGIYTPLCLQSIQAVQTCFASEHGFLVYKAGFRNLVWLFWPKSTHKHIFVDFVGSLS
jgi:hypothetical protein